MEPQRELISYLQYTCIFMSKYELIDPFGLTAGQSLMHAYNEFGGEKRHKLVSCL